MPTINPRINVTLSDSTDHLVKRFAELQRVSKSQVVRELLDTAAPALAQAISLMEAASHAAKGARDTLREALDSTIEQAETQSAEHLANMERITADLVSQAQAVRGRRPRRLPPTGAGLPAPVAEASGRGRAQAVPKPQDPPLSNRGVKPSRRGAKTSLRGVKK